MRLDPVATFFIYTGGIAAVLTVCAFVADTWTAKAERDARRRARAEARAQRGKETEAFSSRSLQRQGSSS
jgi:hypothetical protein